jgi:hypothetical protein
MRGDALRFGAGAIPICTGLSQVAGAPGPPQKRKTGGSHGVSNLLAGGVWRLARACRIVTHECLLTARHATMCRAPSNVVLIAERPPSRRRRCHSAYQTAWPTALHARQRAASLQRCVPPSGSPHSIIRPSSAARSAAKRRMFSSILHLAASLASTPMVAADTRPARSRADRGWRGDRAERGRIAGVSGGAVASRALRQRDASATSKRSPQRPAMLRECWAPSATKAP